MDPVFFPDARIFPAKGGNQRPRLRFALARIAVAMAEGPAAGLALLQRPEIGGALAGYYLLPATRADFLRRLGRNEEAASAYEEAAALAGTGPERR